MCYFVVLFKISHICGHSIYRDCFFALCLGNYIGFKEVKKACCGSGPFMGSSTCGYRAGTSREFELCENVSDYMFFDGSHTSEKANQQTAEFMWDGPSDLVGPFTLKTLFQNL